MNASGLAIQSNKNNPDAINHNFDQFEIWLNPQIQITMEGSIPASYNVGISPYPMEPLLSQISSRFQR